jgi:hypothetical protein
LAGVAASVCDSGMENASFCCHNEAAKRRPDPLLS